MGARCAELTPAIIVFPRFRTSSSFWVLAFRSFLGLLLPPRSSFRSNQVLSGDFGRSPRETLELEDIVAAEDLHLVRMRLPQFTKALLIPEPRMTVLLHHPLIKAQARRAPRGD